MSRLKYLLIISFVILLASGCSRNTGVVVNDDIDVNIQDQSTTPFSIRANQILDTNFELSISPIVNSYDLTLVDASTLIVGDNIAFLEQNGAPQLLFGKILNINTNTITLDTPIPYNFTPSRVTIFTFNNQIKLDGSVTPEVFSITNFFNQSIDITRIIFSCSDSTVMDSAKFCGGNALTRGIVFRKKLLNGNYINYWNIKTNGDWQGIAFDKDYDSKAPAGVYGFSVRLTYGGQSKHGVVIRLEPGESIEVLDQDDLRGLLSGSIMIQGHFTDN